MTGVLDGFATIGILIALGILLAQLGIIDAAGRRTLSTLAFYVASPALLVTVLQDTDVSAVFSDGLVAMVLAIVVSSVTFGVVAVLRREELGAAVIGTLCSAYANAGNLGLPIAAYALGDPASVAPLLLLQLLVLQPLALTLLDVATSPTRLSVGRILARPVTNPITVGSLLGLVLSLTGVRLPHAIGDPLDLVAGMAVPCMLLAYGVSLRLGPLPGRGVPPGELGLVVGLKMVVQPLAAYVVGPAARARRPDAAHGHRAGGPADRPERLRDRDPLRPRHPAGPGLHLHQHDPVGPGHPGRRGAARLSAAMVR